MNRGENSNSGYFLPFSAFFQLFTRRIDTERQVSHTWVYGLLLIRSWLAARMRDSDRLEGFCCVKRKAVDGSLAVRLVLLYDVHNAVELLSCHPWGMNVKTPLIEASAAVRLFRKRE